MVWLGFILIWGGYTTGLYGYSLIRGYNVTLAQLVSPTNWPSTWPPGGGQPASNIVIIPDGKPDNAGSQSVQETAANSPAGTASGGAPGQSVGVMNGAKIRAVAATYGWGAGGQWNALTHLINGESGGNPTIKNQGSGALGIAQALGHGTSCSAGTLGNEYGPQFGLTCKQAQQANSGDGTQQVRWMLGYIKSRYGTPVNAWNQWQSRSPHWY